ncbi:MAG TPA: polyphosphate polymerase domain-containing protein [Verrucomicrobiae bacterium]|jgi:hypothetical protein|nr:polyphosphate polymerase domain-containing protein [Verrucomicrobiae bacterium]
MLQALPSSPSIGRENRESASELKFLVSRPVAEQVRAWSRTNLMPDPHGSGEATDAYRITSLYFDTEQFDVFHRRGSFGRSKFRIRRYGDDENLFLERKLRTAQMLTKRRSLVAAAQLALLTRPQTNGPWDGAWYHRRLLLRQLKPVCQISYHRTARLLMTEAGPVRLTLDENIQALPAEKIEICSMTAREPLLKDEIVMEVKFRRELPLAIKVLLENFALLPTKFSKYRLAAVKLGLVDTSDQSNQSTSPAKTDA